ncbi:uncharacterized protein [Asterias amurensis]|uniref:uncharacterized protein n=1 Tax=Asterias amurensis TaxID=7602 RepID=UPI003AB673DB
MSYIPSQHREVSRSTMGNKEQHDESSGSPSINGETAKQSRCGRAIKNPLGSQDFMIGTKAKYGQKLLPKDKASGLKISIKCDREQVASKSDLAVYEIPEVNRMKLALADLKSKKFQTVTEAARFWKVNRRSLFGRHSGKYKHDGRGCPRYMSAEDEQKVAGWVSRIRQQGFDIKPVMVLNIVPTLFDKKKKNPFNGKSKRPSGRWFNTFLKRHFNTNHFENLEMSVVRALCDHEVTKEVVTKWFCELRSYLSDLDLLDKPDSIWHYCEIPLQFARTSADSERDFDVSIGIGVNASGLVLPPFFIYKEGKHTQVPTDWNPLAGAPSGSRAFVLANRGDVRELHQDWIQKLFTPEIKKDGPVLLLLNCGHMGINYKTHLTLFQNNIHLFRLLPKARSLFCPLDCEDDSDTSFKTRFLHKLTEISYMNNIPLDLNNTPRLINSLWETGIRPQEIQSSFEMSGIYPLDRSMVDDNRLDEFREQPPEPVVFERRVPQARRHKTPPKTQSKLPHSPRGEALDEPTELRLIQESVLARDPKMNDLYLSRLLFSRLDSKLDKPTKLMYRKCLRNKQDVVEAPIYDLWKELYTEGFQTEPTEKVVVVSQEHSYSHKEIVSSCSSPQSPPGLTQELASAGVATVTRETICPLCEEQFTDDIDESVRCSGTCQRLFHISCLPAEIVTPMILEDKDMYCPQCCS